MHKDELKQKALEQFTDYFVRNYPGPDTVIFNPKWHAPKIFGVAYRALSALVAIRLSGWKRHQNAPPLKSRSKVDRSTP